MKCPLPISSPSPSPSLSRDRVSLGLCVLASRPSGTRSSCPLLRAALASSTQRGSSAHRAGPGGQAPGAEVSETSRDITLVPPGQDLWWTLCPGTQEVARTAVTRPPGDVVRPAQDRPDAGRGQASCEAAWMARPAH
uniref:Uncharacterized protein n=1 Tax=Molossus molossus TaxID=27622 RepID=A0A7J8I0Y7_MOLMO|nr:hypothetical protein HJG59_010747 [Molossus molossus]